ncbi:MAG: hypothetical protein WCI96_06490, partial [Planctomycetota bacterium]
MIRPAIRPGTREELAAMLRAARAVAAVREPVRSQRFACAALATACVATAVFSQQIAGFPHGSTVSAFLFARDGDLPRGMPLGNNEESEMSKLRSMVVGSALAIASVASAQNAVEWRVADGGNGHWYAAADAPTGDAAVSLAASLGGNLATISDAAENAHVHAIYIATGKQWAWLGLRQLNGQPSPNAGWHWITGEPYSYLNWTDHSGAFPTGAPDDSPCGLPPWGIENDQANQGVMTPDGRWDDLETGMPTCGSPQWNNTAIIEWSADCNNDGIVDYGQILDGTLADANTNGVPDTCESTLLVPSQYPTIQAAIDAVPAGAHRTVQVAAGTYHESFALNGKDVIVRGAANNATILDGAGLAASIATLSGNEPATAGLEQLVFRNATVGTRIYP